MYLHLFLKYSDIVECDIGTEARFFVISYFVIVRYVSGTQKVNLSVPKYLMEYFCGLIFLRHISNLVHGRLIALRFSDNLILH